jgi:succinoglycan biosynthesis transport protein ExoP
VHLNIHLHRTSGSSAPDHVSPQLGPNWQSTGADPMGRQEWSAIECLRTLYRRKATLAYVMGACIIAAGLISLAQPRWYRSEASLEIQGVNENFLDTRDIYPTAVSSTDSNGTYVQTQAEILQQDALIEQVVKKLHLEARPEFQVGPSPWDKFRRLTGPVPTSVQDVEATADTVKNNIKIMPSRGSRIIRIVSDARDPQVAADIANTLAQTFIEQSIEERQRAARETLVSLSLQLETLRNKLLKSESELAANRRAPGLTFGLRQQSSWLEGSIWKAKLTERELEADRRFYATMSQQFNDARVAAAVRQSNIRFVGPAQPAAHPYRPNLPLNLAIGMFGGLILATSWVILQEQTSSLLRAPGEAGMYLTLPELGVIPQAENPSLEGRGLQPSSDGRVGPGRPATEQQLSGVSESFRATLASILSAGRNGDQPHILVVTSARPMEGKTTVVSNLGIGLAEIGSKVLLIDGDMRRPRLHKLFGQANSWGLSDLLREKNAIEELPLDALVKKTEVPGVYLLPSGVRADNIFGLLWSGRMARLLPRFRQEFDYVLVDAPPCLEFADARIMARYADQVLLVVRANYTDRRTAQVAVQRLLLDGIPVMGVILNRCDPRQGDMYRYAFYYGLSRHGLT